MCNYKVSERREGTPVLPESLGPSLLHYSGKCPLRNPWVTLKPGINNDVGNTCWRWTPEHRSGSLYREPALLTPDVATPGCAETSDPSVQTRNDDSWTFTSSEKMFQNPAQSKQHPVIYSLALNLVVTNLILFRKRYPAGLSEEYPTILIHPIQCNGWIR